MCRLFGIDVFEGALQGLRLAEAEFDSDTEADALILPDFILHEVTDDDRFTGGRLVCASQTDVEKWLAEFGLTLSHPISVVHPYEREVVETSSVNKPPPRSAADST